MAQSNSPARRRAEVCGYIRVSTDRQAESGLSLTAQRDQVRTQAAALAQRLHLRIGKIHEERGVSASKHPLLLRPAGSQLDEARQAGDHVVIAKLDRAFRSVRDCIVTCERWTERGVTIHILDIGMETSTPTGRLMLGLLSAIAQWEAARMGERIREAAAVRRSRGLSTNGHRRLGYRVARACRLVPWPEERAIAARIVRLRAAKKSCKAIAALLHTARVKRPSGGSWDGQSVWRLHAAAKAKWP